MSANVQGTFATGATAVAGNSSDILPVPSGTSAIKLTTTGLSASNTIKTQKRTAGGAWADQVTYNADQTNTSIAAVAGEEWQLVAVAELAITDVRFKLSAES